MGGGTKSPMSFSFELWISHELADVADVCVGFPCRVVQTGLKILKHTLRSDATYIHSTY